MKTQRSQAMRGQRGAKARKSKLLRVTAEVRPDSLISPISTRIQQQLQILFLSKSALFNKNLALILPFDQVERYLPAT
jgi:hypothetical protein